LNRISIVIRDRRVPIWIKGVIISNAPNSSKLSSITASLHLIAVERVDGLVAEKTTRKREINRDTSTTLSTIVRESIRKKLANSTSSGPSNSTSDSISEIARHGIPDVRSCTRDSLVTALQLSLETEGTTLSRLRLWRWFLLGYGRVVVVERRWSSIRNQVMSEL
jgi:hypothetical protein